MSADVFSRLQGDGTVTVLNPGIDNTDGCDPVKTKRTVPYRSWQEIAAEKKAEQRARIPEAWLVPESLEIDLTDLRPLAQASGILTDHDLDITGEHYDATALLDKMAAGVLTAVEVVSAFCKRAAVAQQVCNCLTEIMFADAITAAEKLDDVYNRTGKTVGPLHGLPMTFKVSLNTSHPLSSSDFPTITPEQECFHVKGYDASDGYISRAFDASTLDSHIVSVVRAAGAVVIVSSPPSRQILLFSMLLQGLRKVHGSVTRDSEGLLANDLLACPTGAPFISSMSLHTFENDLSAYLFMPMTLVAMARTVLHDT